MTRFHFAALISALGTFSIASRALAQIPNPSDKAAPAPFTFSGSVRLRYEGLTGQQRPGFDANEELISLRTLMFGEYRAGPLRFGAELQDSRAFLAKARTAFGTNEVNALEPIQLYVAADFRPSWTPRSTLMIEAGRMTVSLGSRRLIASDDYRNTANGSTGIRADFRVKDGVSATIFELLPDQRLPDDVPSLRDNASHFDRESWDLQLTGGIVTVPIRPLRGAIEVMGVRLLERDAPTLATRDRDLANLDVRYFREPRAGQFDGELEGIWQWGRASTGVSATAPRKEVQASFRHLRVGYQWTGAAKPRVAFDYDWVSGDRGSDKIRRFDTLYGMRRSDFAPSGIYNLVGRANLESPGVRLEVAPSSRMDLFAGYRAFWSESPSDAFSTSGVRDATGRSGRFAGQQIDSRLRYWVVPRTLRGEFDGIVFARGGFMKNAPNATGNHDTAYFSVMLQAFF